MTWTKLGTERKRTGEDDLAMSCPSGAVPEAPETEEVQDGDPSFGVPIYSHGSLSLM